MKGVYIPNEPIDLNTCNMYVKEYIVRKKVESIKNGRHPVEYAEKLLGARTFQKPLPPSPEP